MKADDKIPELSLLGGPLHWLGSRLGLVRGGTDTVRLGMALGLLGWGVLMLLALLQGLGHKVFSLAAIGVHARLLVAIPLFFVCETKVAPRMAEFVGNIVRSEVVSPSALPMLESGIAGITRWKDSWIPEAMCLLATVLLPLIGKQLHLVGAMATFDSSRLATEWTLAGRWYWFVCLPLFRFLLFRWLWRLGLWCHFLWRVAKLELDLVPTHPDGAAGLGYLEVVQTYFTPLVLAISVVESASFAEGLSAGTMTFEAVLPALALILVLDAVLFLGPLLIFAPLNLLLGTQDLQSLADLSNSIDNVRNMRWVPLSLRLLESLAISALLPLVPLLLFKYPVADLARNFFTRLTGL